MLKKLLNILSSFIFNYMAWHFFLCMQIAFLFISIIIVVALNNIYLRSVHTPGWMVNGDERATKKDVWMSVWWYKGANTTQVRDAHYTCCSAIFYSWARSNVKKLKFSREVEKGMVKKKIASKMIKRFQLHLSRDVWLGCECMRKVKEYSRMQTSLDYLCENCVICWIWVRYTLCFRLFINETFSHI